MHHRILTRRIMVAAFIVLAVVLIGCTNSGTARAPYQTFGDCRVVANGNCDGFDLSGRLLNGSFGDVRDFSCGGCDFSNSLHVAMNWTGSNFQNTNWEYADLSQSNFNDVNLTGATNLTQEQLDQLASCRGAVLPDGLTCNRS